MTQAVFIYDPRLSQYVLREDHPLRPSRLQYVYELLDSYNAFNGKDSRVITSEPATESDLITFHSRDYIDVVKRLSRNETVPQMGAYNFNAYGDNPPYEGMYEASLLPVSASLTGGRVVVENEAEVAFNIGGGMHHAGHNHASGFCVFNDVVVGIKSLVAEGLRVAYIDIDAHHGDGVQNAFYETDRVLTISIHESGRYLFPGTGEVTEIGSGLGKGFAVNLPMPPNVDDETYLWGFKEVVPPLVTYFAPDVLVSQLGCDLHYSDSLSDLMLTTYGYVDIIKEIKKLAKNKWLALGGGGYDMSAVARCWTLAYGVMTGREWPDDTPASFREKYGIMKLRDDYRPQLDPGTKSQVKQFVMEKVEAIKFLVLARHGL
jgi:acetoin utilization protein AcuC